MNLPTYLTIKQAAIYMGLSEQTIRSFVRAGKLEGVKIGEGEKREKFKVHRDALNGIKTN